LQKFNQTLAPTAEETAEKKVTLFLQSSLTQLVGDWHWDLSCENVFCSDVMLSLPGEFQGTKGIVHPDDVAGLQATLNEDDGLGMHLMVRMITTYGEVVKLEGHNITRVEENEEPTTDLGIDTQAADDYARQKEIDRPGITTQLPIKPGFQTRYTAYMDCYRKVLIRTLTLSTILFTRKIEQASWNLCCRLTRKKPLST
jgi:hypothetical protein